MVWEHAYYQYVDYHNVRPEYISAIWDVINRKVVEERLTAATADETLKMIGLWSEVWPGVGLV